MIGAALLLLLTQTEKPVSQPGFTHVAHGKLGVALECASCHPSDARGELGVPGKDHAPCRDAGCHASEFRRRESPLCLACHAHDRPFAANPTRASFALRPGQRSEFSVGFSHKAHSTKDNPAGCAGCHPRQAGQAASAPPAGLRAPSHLGCAECHEKKAKPPMGECAACHRAGSAVPAAGDPRWRVAAKFPHERHTRDARTARGEGSGPARWAPGDGAAGTRWLDPTSAAPLPCAACHLGVDDMAAGQPLPRPTMEGCAATCHDGRVSFKATGHGCARCHGPRGAAG